MKEKTHFLKIWGSYEFEADEFMGIESNKKDVSECTLIKFTEELRSKGMPSSLLAILYMGDYAICLDSGGKVVNWSQYDQGNIVKMNDDFTDYWYEKLEDMM